MLSNTSFHFKQQTPHLVGPAPPDPGEKGACCTSATSASRSGTLLPWTPSMKYPLLTESPITRTFFLVLERGYGAPVAHVDTDPGVATEGILHAQGKPLRGELMRRATHPTDRAGQVTLCPQP